jgi:hypothetical protein
MTAGVLDFVLQVAAEQDVDATTSHVGGDSDRVRDPPLLERAREPLGLLDRRLLRYLGNVS